MAETLERKEAIPMSRSTTQTEPTIIDRYQDFRTRRFLKHERTYANALPGWAPNAGVACSSSDWR